MWSYLLINHYRLLLIRLKRYLLDMWFILFIVCYLTKNVIFKIFFLPLTETITEKSGGCLEARFSKNRVCHSKSCKFFGRENSLIFDVIKFHKKKRRFMRFWYFFFPFRWKMFSNSRNRKTSLGTIFEEYLTSNKSSHGKG